jgi:hypothetical protein
MSDLPEANIATMALLNLIRLLATELVAGEHRHDVAKVIAAMDRKLDSTPLPRGIDVNDARAGIRSRVAPAARCLPAASSSVGTNNRQDAVVADA